MDPDCSKVNMTFVFIIAGAIALLIVFVIVGKISKK